MEKFSCPDGKLLDCKGNCVDFKIYNSFRDAICDKGKNGPNFNCKTYRFDGGDCRSNQPDVKCPVFASNFAESIIDIENCTTDHSGSAQVLMDGYSKADKELKYACVLSDKNAEGAIQAFKKNGNRNVKSPNASGSCQFDLYAKWYFYELEDDLRGNGCADFSSNGKEFMIAPDAFYFYVPPDFAKFKVRLTTQYCEGPPSLLALDCPVQIEESYTSYSVDSLDCPNNEFGGAEANWYYKWKVWPDIVSPYDGKKGKASACFEVKEISERGKNVICSDCRIPTMGFWSLLIFTLLLLNIATIYIALAKQSLIEKQA